MIPKRFHSPCAQSCVPSRCHQDGPFGGNGRGSALTVSLQFRENRHLHGLWLVFSIDFRGRFGGGSPPQQAGLGGRSPPQSKAVGRGEGRQTPGEGEHQYMIFRTHRYDN